VYVRVEAQLKEKSLDRAVVLAVYGNPAAADTPPR
jgi:hypothetical protein